MPDSPTITVDFNNTDDDGLLFARMARAERPLIEDEAVVASDGEGHQAQARVARIDGEIVYLAVDPATWVAAEAPIVLTERDTRVTFGAFQEKVVVVPARDPAEELGGHSRTGNLIPS